MKNSNYFLSSNFYKFLFSLSVIIIQFLSCGKIQDKESSVLRVKYLVNSVPSGKEVNLTLETGNGTSTQYNGEVTPYESSSMSFKPGEFMYISARNQTSTGSIKVTIIVNGNIYKESTCSGEYCMASASGSVE